MTQLPGRITLLPADWRIPVGERVQFVAEGVDSATLLWSVNGIPGGNATFGFIASDGWYAAPTAMPSGNPVTVRAALASDPTRFVESPVTVTWGGEPARVVWSDWTPRVIALGSTHDVTLEAGFSGYPRFALERSSGVLPSIALRSGVYGFRLSAADVLAGYDVGDLHYFAGYLTCDICVNVRRGNMFVNVKDATVPSVSVTALAEDVQAASHVVNIRYDDLFLAAYIPDSVLRRFYAFFPDAFDFVAVIEQLTSFHNRSYRAVRNDVDGVGLARFDNGSLYSSPARLQGLIDYPISGYFDAGEHATVHEIGHHWMAFLDNAMLAANVPHWPASSMARGIIGYSTLGGQGLDFPFQVRNVSGNVYQLVCSGLASEFNDLELYLMGLIPPESVSTHVVFQDQNMALGCGSQGTTDSITIADIVQLNGARDPDYRASQRGFRLATIVLSMGRLLSVEEMAFFNHMAERGEATTELHYTSGFAEGTTKPFYLATGGRATLTTRVLP